MDRELEIQMKPEDAGVTVGTFLRIRLGFSKKQISRLKFRENGIRIDGVQRRTDYRLRAGELLKIRLEEKTGEGQESRVIPCPGAEHPDILFENADLLAVNKPAGMVCHPSHGHYLDTLANRAAAYLERKGEPGTIRLVGRLDKDTSGIVLFAKNREAAAALGRQRRCGSLRKGYLALVSGCPEPAEGTVDAPIDKIPGELMRMQVSAEGKPARTHYCTLKTFQREGAVCSLLQLTLEHGRTHQIRVHMTYLGCPLMGDPLYGADPRGGGALLHAWKLQFFLPFTGEQISLETELPGWAQL